MKIYRSAPMDKLTLWVTISIFALFLFFIVLAVAVHQGWVPWMPVILMGLVIAFSWQIRVRRYEIREDSIRIVRGFPLRNIVIPLSEVQEIHRFNDFGDHRQTLRLLGVGGFFSSSGIFWNKETGEFFGMVTNMGEAVYIKAKQKFVISPERPDEFAECLRKAIENTAQTTD